MLSNATELNSVGGGFGGGFGGIGAVGIIGLNTLFDRDRGRVEADGGGGAIFAATTLSKLGSIEAAIPLAAATMTNVLLEQTNELNQVANANNLAQLAASASVKDTVQNTASIALVNASNNTASIIAAVNGLSSKIDQNRISELETQLAESRHIGRSRDVEVNVTQTVNQAQAQAQAQAQTQQQFSQLFNMFNHLAGDIQAVKQGQVIFNSGTMAASGTQAAATTKVA